MNNINVNGKSYTIKGNNVSVVTTNGKTVIYSDGVQVVTEESKEVTIKWEGNLANLSVSDSLTVNGSIHGNVDAKTINCGNVGGNIQAKTVSCSNVKGNIKM